MQTQTDSDLIAAYVDSGDQKAFAELVLRHQRMVYRVCQRMLGQHQEAEDATQAVFLVMLHKANELTRKGELTGWLYGVARNVALEALRKRGRRKEEVMLDETETVAAEDSPDHEAALQSLDRELAGLSGVLRQAVVLRYLQGYDQAEAARQAGCSMGTLASRASRGIERLRQRLAKRGVALSGVALASLLTSEASAAVPETLLPSILATVKTAVATTATATTATSTAAMLAKGAMKAMFWNSVKTAAMVAVTVGVVGVGGVAAVQAVAEKAAPKPVAAAAIVETTNTQSTASTLAFKVHPGDPVACAEAYRKTFKMLKALPASSLQQWWSVSEYKAKATQEQTEEWQPIYEQALIASQYENVDWQLTVDESGTMMPIFFRFRNRFGETAMDLPYMSYMGQLPSLMLVIGRYRLEHGDPRGFEAWCAAWMIARHAAQGGPAMAHLFAHQVYTEQLPQSLTMTRLGVPAAALTDLASALAALPEPWSFVDGVKSENRLGGEWLLREYTRLGDDSFVKMWMEKADPEKTPSDMSGRTPEQRAIFVKRYADDMNKYLLDRMQRVFDLPVSEQKAAFDRLGQQTSTNRKLILETAEQRAAFDKLSSEQKAALVGPAHDSDSDSEKQANPFVATFAKMNEGMCAKKTAEASHMSIAMRPLIIAACRAAATPVGAPLPEVTNPLTGKPIEVKRISGGVEAAVHNPWLEDKPVRLRLVFGE